MSTYIKIKKLHMPEIGQSELDLTVEKGQMIAITGRNGAGKSAFARYLAGITRPERIGQILIDGLDPFSQLDERKLHRLVGMSFQDPYIAKALDNVGRDMIFGMENIGMDRDRTKKRLKFYLKKLSLGKKSKLNYTELSRSEAERAALGAALTMHPSLLLLDEPLLSQGKEKAKELFLYIKKQAEKKKQTIIVFTKKLWIAELCDQTYLMENGRLDDITFDLSIFDAWVQSEHDTSDHVEIIAEDSAGELERVDDEVTFQPDMIYYVKGQAASGKTRLLKTMADPLLRDKLRGGIPRSATVSYVSQNPEEMFIDDSVLADVMLGLVVRGSDKIEARRLAIECLKSLGVSEDTWNRSPMSLSYGEKKLVAIAGALVMNHDYLLLDDPMTGLDAISQDALYTYLKSYVADHHTVIIAER